MGVNVELQLNRFGFYPADGGEITATIIAGNKLTPLHLEGRRERVNALGWTGFVNPSATLLLRYALLVAKLMLGKTSKIDLGER